ncbi:hypothetical protein ACG7TL_006952 [Trametes sanguinea]
MTKHLIDRLVANMRRRERVLAILSIICAFIGMCGLILLSIFDTKRHPSLHRVFLLVFILGVGLSAIFTVIEYRWISHDFVEIKKLKKAYLAKGTIAGILILLAIAFAITLFQATDPGAILEWIIAFGFTFYILTFFFDLRMAKGVHKGELSRRRLLAMRERGQGGEAAHEANGAGYGPGANGYANGSANGHTNGYANGSARGPANGSLNSYPTGPAAGGASAHTQMGSVNGPLLTYLRQLSPRTATLQHVPEPPIKPSTHSIQSTHSWHTAHPLHSAQYARHTLAHRYTHANDSHPAPARIASTPPRLALVSALCVRSDAVRAVHPTARIRLPGQCEREHELGSVGREARRWGGEVEDACAGAAEEALWAWFGSAAAARGCEEQSRPDGFW